MPRSSSPRTTCSPRPAPRATSSAACPCCPGAGAALRLIAATSVRKAGRRDRHRRRRRVDLAAARHAPRRGAHDHRRRARAPPGGPRDLRRGRASRPTGSGSSPGGRWRCCPGSPTAPTTSCSATRDKKEYAGYLEQALRLLRPGGVVAFDNALWHDRVADPTQRDEDTTAIRELGRAVRDDERLASAMLPCRRRAARRRQDRLGRSCEPSASAAAAGRRTRCRPCSPRARRGRPGPGRRCRGAPTAGHRRTRAGTAPR